MSTLEEYVDKLNAVVAKKATLTAAQQALAASRALVDVATTTEREAFELANTVYNDAYEVAALNEGTHALEAVLSEAAVDYYESLNALNADSIEG